MSIFTYNSTRELAPGSVQDGNTSRDFRLVSFPISIASKRKQNTSLGGQVESLLFRQEKQYRCQVEKIDPNSLQEAYIIEFFASVQNGEPFTFDRFGTVAFPDNPVSCIMVSNRVTGAEVGKKYLQYGFVIREG